MKPCADLLICPICGEPLRDADRSLRCGRGHTFDRAREGYVDLLPAGHGRSKLRGDTSEMLRARRRFLARGYYEPLSDAINERCARHLAGLRAAGEPKRRRAVLDVGCGVGYYLGRLMRHAEAAAPDAAACFFGIDLSKSAVRLAARTYERAHFLINDVNHRLCLADGSVDLLLDVFAPRNPGEFARVLRPDGLLIVVVPNDRHMLELRTALPLLEIEPDKLERTVARFDDTFSLLGHEELEYRRTVTGDDVADLLRMSPNRWHLDEAAMAAAAAINGTRLTIGFRILRFQTSGRGRHAP